MSKLSDCCKFPAAILCLVIGAPALADLVAFTGKDANGDDEFAFVALQTLPSSTQIFFTNNDWDNTSGEFLTTSNEQTVVFLADAEIPMGTVVRIAEVGSTQVFTVTGASGSATLVTGGSSTVSADPHYAFGASNASSPLNTVTEIFAYMDTDPDDADGSSKDPRIGTNPSPNAMVVDFQGIQPVNTDFSADRSTALASDLTNPANFTNDAETDITLDLTAFTALTGQLVNLEIAPSPANLSEAGDTATISACLSEATAASEDVIVTLGVTGVAVPGVDHDLLDGNAITIVNGATCGDTSLTPYNDDVDEGDEGIQVSIASLPAGYTSGSSSEVNANIIDDDTAGITIDPTSGLVTSEAGGTDTFTVVLDSEPTDDVTVEFQSSDPGEGTLSTASLVFTPSDWNMSQAATVVGMDDPDMDGDVSFVIGVASSSADLLYDSLSLPVIEVTNIDDDLPDLIFSDQFTTP